MSKALAPTNELVFRGVNTTVTGLTFEHKMSAGLWNDLIKRIMEHRNAANWWMGDALNAGDEWLGEEMPSYVQLELASQATMNNVMRTARIFKPERRRVGLSFSHHMEVAGFETEAQERLLNLAEQHGWNREQLREAAKDVRAETKLLMREAKAAEIEDAEEVDEEQPLAGEPQVIEGHAVEVQDETSPEANIAPVEGKDLLEVLWTTWQACDYGQRRTFFLRAMEDLGPFVHPEEKERALKIIDALDAYQESLANGPCEAVPERAASLVAPENGAAEAGEAGQPASIPATTDRMVGANVSGVTNAGVTDRRDGQFNSPPSAPVLTDDDLEIPEFLDRRSKERADV